MVGHFLLIFNWRIIALQCCAGFWHRTMWISLQYTYVPFFLTLLLIACPPHSTPLGYYRVPDWAPYVIQQLPTSYLFYIWWCICFNVALSIHPTLSFPTVSASLFSTSVSLFYSCPANRFISTIFLDSTYMCYYTIFVFLFRTYFTLYNRL